MDLLQGQSHRCLHYFVFDFHFIHSLCDVEVVGEVLEQQRLIEEDVLLIQYVLSLEGGVVAIDRSLIQIGNICECPLQEIIGEESLDDQGLVEEG